MDAAGPQGRGRARAAAVAAGALAALASSLLDDQVLAADLAAEPAPAAAVRACPGFGDGFIVVPGTDTCFLLSGYTVAEWHVFGGDRASRQPGFYGDEDANVGYAKANLAWHSATDTDFGAVRAHAKLELVDTATFGGLVYNLKESYVEVAGFTVGRLQSPFDFITGTTYADIYEPAWSDVQTTVAAYTAPLGSGLSATLSVEDAVTRRVGIIGARGGDRGYAEGVRLPDFVATLAFEEGSTEAKLMAALHEVRAARGGAAAEIGWTVAAGAIVDVPFTGEGDQAMLQASIGQGALSYGATNPIGPGRNFAGADARLIGRRLILADVWAIGAVYDHVWTEGWVSELNGSVLDIDQAGRRYDFRNLDAQVNLSFAPADGLKFTGEAEYKWIDRTRGRDGEAFVMMFVAERGF
jgi:hypothetical protein